jgi:hypothetical protein
LTLLAPVAGDAPTAAPVAAAAAVVPSSWRLFMPRFALTGVTLQSRA